jgi:uncharacterized membrane protein
LRLSSAVTCAGSEIN